MIPQIFQGETVFLVAGGPSLIGFDFSRLKNRRVLAINRAHEFLPGAELLWWSDASFWRRNKEALMVHAARWKGTGHLHYQEGELPPDIHVYRFTGPHGFDDRADCLRDGNSSAYAAMHLLAHLGAAKIVLLGLDLRFGPNRESHFHSGHGRLHLEVTLTDLMAPMFLSLARPLAQRGIEVLNASPTSALTIWPRCSIDEALQ